MTTQQTQLTPSQVADRIGVSTRTLARWRARNEGPPFITLSDRTARYPSDGFERWLASRPQQGGTSGLVE